MAIRPSNALPPRRRPVWTLARLAHSPRALALAAPCSASTGRALPCRGSSGGLDVHTACSGSGLGWNGWLPTNALALALALAGCATAPPVKQGQTSADNDAARAHPTPPPAPAPSADMSAFPPPLPAKLDAGSMGRGQLLVTLEAGIPRFLRQFEVKAERRQGRFFGWRIVKMDHPKRAEFVVRAGDVLVRVNRHSLERPEQLVQVWQSLASAGELVLDVVRGDQPSEIRLTITDDRLTPNTGPSTPATQVPNAPPTPPALPGA